MKHIEIRKNGRKRVYTTFEEPTMTDESFAKDCDVNNIVKKFTKTGLWPTTQKQGVFRDLTSLPMDLHSAMETVTSANSAFQQLPAEIRKRFRNDPQQLLEFISNEKNRDEAVNLGLIDGSNIPNRNVEQTKRSAVVPNKHEPPKPPTNDDKTTND